MFDIGFFELLLVAVMALLVIGPERLPEAVRAVALWIGRLKRSLAATRAELEQQLGADDIRRQLHNESIMRELNASREDIERVLRDDYVAHTELPDHAHSKASAQPAAPKADSPKPDTPTS